MRGMTGRAGGIRTHGLELMRLARTAAPLPRSECGRGRKEAAPSGRSDHVRRWHTILFMPLACPSSLDRVRRGGGLEPGASTLSEKPQAKAAAGFAAVFLRAAQRGLSLVGGASGSSDLRHAEHHLSNCDFRSVVRQKRATRWVALASCNMASFLAHAPFSEGLCVSRPTRETGDHLLAAQNGRRRRRFGKRRVNVECLHGCSERT